MNLQKVGLIGFPLGHTISPYIHQKLFEWSLCPHDYRVMDIENLNQAFPSLREMNGFNVTIPYKSRIIPFLDSLSEQAKACGSVNTVLCKNGKMSGFTTDGIGCLRSLRDAGMAKKGRILLLGNGGAARAMAFALIDRAQCLCIACRETARDQALRLKADLEDYTKYNTKQLSVKVKAYEALCARGEEYDLLLNATSVGMYPHIHQSPVNVAVLRHCGAVFDAVYNPAMTVLLRQAKELNIPAVGGIGMLVHQAAAAHEIWYGAKFTADQIRTLCQGAALYLKTKKQPEAEQKT